MGNNSPRGSSHPRKNEVSSNTGRPPGTSAIPSRKALSPPVKRTTNYPNPVHTVVNHSRETHVSKEDVTSFTVTRNPPRSSSTADVSSQVDEPKKKKEKPPRPPPPLFPRDKRRPPSQPPISSNSQNRPISLPTSLPVSPPSPPPPPSSLLASSYGDGGSKAGEARPKPPRSPPVTKPYTIVHTYAEDSSVSVENRPLPSPTSRYQIVEASRDYKARTNRELNVTKGDQFEVLDDHGDWWLARSVVTREEGCIPRDCFAKPESPESETWYFGDLSAKEAEENLKRSENRNGSFLIRKEKDVLYLSVVDGDTVRHHYVNRKDNNEKKYYINVNKAFRNLRELVHHYKGDTAGIDVKLRKPCIPLQMKKTTKSESVGVTQQELDIYEIPRSSIVLNKKLGSGNFGDVWEGVWSSKTRVAIKTLGPGTNQKDFLKEVTAMMKLRHPRLVHLYAICTREQPIWIVMELMTQGSLLTFLKKDNGSTLGLRDLVDMGEQIASGMAYLESQHFIHRDVAARNILVGENNDCKVADFGLSRFSEESAYSAKEGTKLPVRWTAPEAITTNLFSIKSDVWSFGILLTEIITFCRSFPYKDMTNQEVIMRLERGYRMPCPDGCPERLYNVIRQCWQQNPEDRPTFRDLHNTLINFFEKSSRYV